MQIRPKFQIEADAPIFTMGSCFARNVENVLQSLGVPMLMAGAGIRLEYYEGWDEKNNDNDALRSKLDRSFFNKYSVHSMSHELRRILKNEEYPDAGLIELAPGKWFDPHATRLKLADKEVALENRRSIEQANSRIKQARVVFFTLGLTETWLDTETGLAMNAPPPSAYLVRNSNRFHFVNYGYSETVNELYSTIQLVRETCNPDMRFVVTVSPVPLGSTFKNLDVIVANSASKSLLRTAADEIAQQFDYVDYFPSYEMVVNSPRAMAWEPDQIHVASDMVATIMRRFQTSYFSPR